MARPSDVIGASNVSRSSSASHSRRLSRSFLSRRDIADVSDAQSRPVSIRRNAVDRADSESRGIISRRHFGDRAESQRITPPVPSKAIYIYPGLLRHARQKAMNLDSQCPATIYKCSQCKEETLSDEEVNSTCSHSNGCSICLDEFHTRDLVRNLPCSARHMVRSTSFPLLNLGHWTCANY